MPDHSKILIIEPSRKVQNEFRKLLSDTKFIVEFGTSVDEGIFIAMQKRFDLIICKNDFKYITGFQVFNKLESSLLKNNTAFFLILEKFKSDDVLIGLEMGIDNFIVCPIQKQSVLHKIQNQFRKQQEYNFVESERFKEIFKKTPAPFFVVKNHYIVEINNACKNFLNIKNYDKDNLMFMDVFNIEYGCNHLKMRKLENGLVEYCKLENVKLRSNSKNVFTINKYNLNRSQGGKVFAEIVIEHNGADNSGPQNGRHLKVDQKEKADILSKFKLTVRESEVFGLSAKGYPIKQIADILTISERTVEKHRANIMFKTRTHNIIEAIIKVKDINEF